MLKTFFAIIILIHGLIHFMGFSKAFGYGNSIVLTKDISKTAGSLWLIAAFLFIGATVIFLFKKEWWWFPAIVAVILSQCLIFTSWSDAKFGTIANLIILIITIIGYGTWSFSKQYKDEVETYLQKPVTTPESLLTESDIQSLPEPVKKYLRYSGAVNKPKVKNFRIEFKGQIRKNKESEWMPFKSVQYNFMDASTRLFFLNATMKHWPVTGFHCFKNGTAFMDIRLFSLFTVQYQSGKEMDTAETVTFFNDMCCMAPATLIDKKIKWLENDNNKVKASFTNKGITITAWLFFTEKGELVNFVTDDRYAAGENNSMIKLRWSTPLREYKEFKGYNLSSAADVIYTYPDGEFCYGQFHTTSIEYNCAVYK